MSYNNSLLNYYNFNKNYNKFYKNNKNLGIGFAGAPICGDLIKFQILVSKNGFIIDSKFKAYGCGSAMASISLLSNYIKGKKIYQIIYFKNIYISQELNLPPIKLHCSILAEEVVNLSIKNYKNNYIIG